MTADEMREVVCDVWVPDFEFHIFEGEVRDCYLHGRYMAADIVTGDPEDQHTRKWRLSIHMTRGEIVQTALACYLASMEHRARENFRYKGKRIYGPHFDVSALRTKE